MKTRLKQKKSLGQVFLNVEWPGQMTAQSIRQCGVEHVVEIGPGSGILTRSLLAAGLKVTAVEKDERYAETLRAACGAFDESRLKIVQSDFLTFRLDHWLAEHRDGAIVGNIPYYISSQILDIILRNFSQLKTAIILTQKEFAERVCSEPGTKAYGSLSVYTQLRSTPKILSEVTRTCFTPIPAVDSALLQLYQSRVQYDAEELKKSEQLSRMAFAQRRKVLSNALKTEFNKLDVTEDCPIDLQRRPDALSPEDYISLARFFLENAP